MNTVKKKRTPLALKIIAALLLIIAITLLISNYWLQTSNYEISNANLPPAFDGYRIVVLADLHSAEFGTDNQWLLRAVEKQQPDIILLSGDMVNSRDSDFSTFFNLAEELSARWPVYYVTGNHEQALIDRPGGDAFLQQLRETQVIVLDNEKVELSRDGESIDLYGLWYGLRFYSAKNNEYSNYNIDVNDITESIGPNDQSRFSILLTHNPLYFPSYAEWGADLTLSGHIHGGMIRIPGKGGLFSPDLEFFPEYDAGQFDLNGHAMLVSRGLGIGIAGFRLFNCPDIVSITLRAE